MIVLLEVLVLAVLGLLAVNIWSAMRGGDRRVEAARERPPVIDGVAERVSAEPTPGRAAALALERFEAARAELKAQYPSVFAMLGGYLNAASIHEAGGLEPAVRTMIADWTGRADVVSREQTRILADHDSEADVRAVLLAACDAEFEEEGYRKWTTWLLARFNAL